MIGKTRRVAGAAATALAALGLSATSLSAAQASVATPAASTQTHQSTTTAATYSYKIQNVYTSRCLDDSLANGVGMLSCDGSNNQKFTFPLPQSDGASEIRNVQTGRCLDFNVTYGFRFISCNGSNDQLWQIVSSITLNPIESFIENAKTYLAMEDTPKGGLQMVTTINGSEGIWIVG